MDFRLLQKTEWLIECVSIRTSKGAKRAMRKRGDIYEQHFTSLNSDPHQTPEGEMIRMGELIAEKAYARDRPTKFPTVSPGRYHVIVVDTRGYLDGGGDISDFRQIAYGQAGIPQDREWMLHWWGPPGEERPIQGLFEKGNPVRGAETMRERIHFLHFVQEDEYVENEILRRGYLLGNPWLFDGEEEMGSVLEDYPLFRGSAA